MWTTYICTGPVLNETVTSSINDEVITIQWSVLTSGAVSILLHYTIEWITPDSDQFTIAPGGTVEDGVTYLEISLGRVLAGHNYQYRIKAVNSNGLISNYVFFQLRSSIGMYTCTGIAV